jgi:hypothetical protein
MELVEIPRRSHSHHPKSTLILESVFIGVYRWFKGFSLIPSRFKGKAPGIHM